MLNCNVVLTVLLAGCACHLSAGFSVNIDRHQFRAGPFSNDVTGHPLLNATLDHPMDPSRQELRQGASALVTFGQGLAALLAPLLGQALGGVLGPGFGSFLGPLLGILGTGIAGTSGNRLSLNVTDDDNVTTSASDDKHPDAKPKNILDGYLVNIPGYGDCVVLARPGDDPQTQNRMFLPLPNPFHRNRVPWNHHHHSHHHGHHQGHHHGHHQAPHTVNHVSVLPVPLAVAPFYSYPHWRRRLSHAVGLHGSAEGETTAADK